MLFWGGKGGWGLGFGVKVLRLACSRGVLCLSGYMEFLGKGFLQVFGIRSAWKSWTCLQGPPSYDMSHTSSFLKIPNLIVRDAKMTARCHWRLCNQQLHRVLRNGGEPLFCVAPQSSRPTVAEWKLRRAGWMQAVSHKGMAFTSTWLASCMPSGRSFSNSGWWSLLGLDPCSWGRGKTSVRSCIARDSSSKKITSTVSVVSSRQISDSLVASTLW